MESQVGLDPLALSTLIFMRASRAGQTEAANIAGYAAKRHLILLFPTLHRFGIAEAMYRFYENWIWSGTHGLGNDVKRRVSWMSALVSRLRLLGATIDTVKAEEKAFRYLLNGRFGFEVSAALLAPISSSPEPSSTWAPRTSALAQAGADHDLHAGHLTCEAAIQD